MLISVVALVRLVLKASIQKNEKSQREVKNVFTIMHCGVSYNVCRKGFMAMHGLSRDRV